MKIPVLSILAALSLSAAAIGAGFPNGAPADLVLGQTDFTSAGNGTSPRLFALAADVAVDPPTGKVFVSDNSNRRVLRFDNISARSSGDAADGVLGQPDFTSDTAGPTASLFAGPFGLTFDPAGRLWVADFSGSRVLRFTPDSTPPAVTFTGKIPKTTSKSRLKIKGTATDAAGVSTVQAPVGGGAFANATGTTAWTSTAKVKKGRNRIQAIATDSVGNTSQPISATVRRKEARTLAPGAVGLMMAG